MIAANNVAGKDGAFGNPLNSVTRVSENAEVVLEKMEKTQLAEKLMEIVVERSGL